MTTSLKDNHPHAGDAWEWRFSLLRKITKTNEEPSVDIISKETGDPFSVLISTIISLRTKDEVTLRSSRRLLKRASTPMELAGLTQKEIEQLIYPAGFYRKKAANLLTIVNKLLKDLDGRVPNNMEDLLSLPGVGRKTANLVLAQGYSIPAICVDIHVHRISNRLGWVKTRTPDATEQALRKSLPKNYWIEINGLMVSFGQTLCRPVSPFCSECAFLKHCPQIGVKKNR